MVIEEPDVEISAGLFSKGNVLYFQRESSSLYLVAISRNLPLDREDSYEYQLTRRDGQHLDSGAWVPEKNPRLWETSLEQKRISLEEPIVKTITNGGNSYKAAQ